jgi:hypothetical protein
LLSARLFAAILNAGGRHRQGEFVATKSGCIGQPGACARDPALLRRADRSRRSRMWPGAIHDCGRRSCISSSRSSRASSLSVFARRLRSVPVQPGRLARLDARDAGEQLAKLDLPAVARQQIAVALGIIEHLNGELHTLDLELERIARRQPGCRALMGHYGIGPLVATRSSPSLAIPGGCRPPSRRCAAPAWTSPCMSPTRAAATGISHGRVPRCCAGPL